MSRTASPPRAAASLPLASTHTPRGGPPRRSRRARWRALALVLVHVLALAHVAHWKLAGATLSPLEPSEAGQTLELGYVNAGFLLFGVAILTTLVLGRFFCGWACHLVAYQDLCAWLLGRVGLRPRPLRARLLVWIPLFAALRMFVWPTLVRLQRGGGVPELQLHLTTTTFCDRFPGPWIALLTFLVDGFLVVWFLGGKGFCTYGCPYGAFFGLADRFARGRIRVTDACEGCGHCTATCTSNVRVHAEVAQHRMVVDPGCMKCMDCVSVCPKGALYFGFGPLPRSDPAPKRPRSYDLSAREELSFLALFAAALYALNGTLLPTEAPVAPQVPFLLSIGLAVLAAGGVLLAWRMLLASDLCLQHVGVRRAGRTTRAGWAALAAVALLAVTVADYGLFSYHRREGERELLRARALPHTEPAFAETVGASLAHFERAERWLPLESALLHERIGTLLAVGGDYAAAERRLRRVIELEPERTGARLQVADLLTNRGELAGALAQLEAVLEREPESLDVLNRLGRLVPSHEPARYVAAEVLLRLGDLDAAHNALAPLAARDPVPARAKELLARIAAAAAPEESR